MKPPSRAAAGRIAHLPPRIDRVSRRRDKPASEANAGGALRALPTRRPVGADP